MHKYRKQILFKLDSLNVQKIDIIEKKRYFTAIDVFWLKQLFGLKQLFQRKINHTGNNWHGNCLLYRQDKKINTSYNLRRM